MAAGKPVVATMVGGAAEAVVDGETGYLVPTDDDAALAERLMTLLRDAEMSSRFGQAGKQAVSERFSLSSQLASTVKLYNSLIDKN